MNKAGTPAAGDLPCPPSRGLPPRQGLADHCSGENGILQDYIRSGPKEL